MTHDASGLDAVVSVFRTREKISEEETEARGEVKFEGIGYKYHVQL